MKKRDIVLILFNVISTALILFIYSENYSELIFNAFLFIGIMVFSSTVAGYISLEINKKLRTASKEELKAEDSVLLRGIGLLQSTAFIYINLIPNEDSIAFLILKLTIPIFTAIFFITRGYGAIRESPVHRFFSIIVLFWYLIFEVAIFILISINLSSNIILFYVVLGFLGVLIAFFDKLAEITSTRYGLEYISMGKRRQIEEENKKLEMGTQSKVSEISSDKSLNHEENIDSVSELDDPNLKWLIERSHDAYLSYIGLWLAGMLGVVTVLLNIASTPNYFGEHGIFLISIYATLGFGMVFALYRIANILEEHIRWGMQIKDEALRNEIINHRGRLSRFVVNSEGKLSKRNRNLGIALQIILTIIFFVLATFPIEIVVQLQ